MFIYVSDIFVLSIVESTLQVILLTSIGDQYISDDLCNGDNTFFYIYTSNYAYCTMTPKRLQMDKDSYNQLHVTYKGNFTKTDSAIIFSCNPCAKSESYYFIL